MVTYIAVKVLLDLDLDWLERTGYLIYWAKLDRLKEFSVYDEFGELKLLVYRG